MQAQTQVLCSYRTEAVSEMKEEINQPHLHEHPLKLQRSDDKVFQQSHNRVLTCEGCRKKLWGQIYGCNNCKFFLHKSCTLLPREKKHFCHPCPLILGIVSVYDCRTCPHKGHGFTYHCEQCRFHVHCWCLDMDPVSSTAAVSGSEEERIPHFFHSHPLTRFTFKSGDPSKYCRFCQMECLGPGYACLKCNFYFHRSCLDISTPTIDQHTSHPCRLILVPMIGYDDWCSACDNQCGRLTFICGKCRFYLCSICFLMPAIRSNENEIIERTFLGQRLILRERKVTAGDYGCYVCAICDKICSGPAYVNDKSKFFHTSCVEIPEQIENYYHSTPRGSQLWNELERSHVQYHSSTIWLQMKTNTEQCKLCSRWGHYVYSCRQCFFLVGAECAFLKPTVKDQGHSHPLTLIERIHTESECDHCRAPFEIDSPVFRCQLSCNFTLHLLCGPLPCSVKIKYHVHPLTLKEFVEEHGPNDDNYCCHVCEQRRNPRSPVYYCSDCRFEAEVDCVMSEVIPMLKGECGAVELRNLGEVIKTKVITGETAEAESNCSPLAKILHSLQELQPKEYNDLMHKIIRRRERPYDDTISYRDMSTVGIFGDKYFQEFMYWLNSGIPSGNLEDFMFEQDEEFATFGNYWVARVHIPIMEALFAKYGDISLKSKLSPEFKSIHFLVLCGVIHRMRLSIADCVTKKQLHNWWSFLKFVEDADFEIQFVFDHLRHIASAYYGFQSQKSIVIAKKKQEDEIKRISSEIIKLQREMETAQKELERLNSKRRTQLMAQVHNQAMQMKLKTAADGLL